MTFTSRLKEGCQNVLISSEIGSEWRTILGHPQLIECMGICVLSLAHGSELRGSDIICILRKRKIIQIFLPAIFFSGFF